MNTNEAANTSYVAVPNILKRSTFVSTYYRKSNKVNTIKVSRVEKFRVHRFADCTVHHCTPVQRFTFCQMVEHLTADFTYKSKHVLNLKICSHV